MGERPELEVEFQLQLFALLQGFRALQENEEQEPMDEDCKGIEFQLSASKHRLQFRHHAQLFRIAGARYGKPRQHDVAINVVERFLMEQKFHAPLGPDKKPACQFLLWYER